MENRQLKAMIKDRQAGLSMENVVRKNLGNRTADQVEELSRQVHRVFVQAGELERKYAGVRVGTAILQEIDEQYGEDKKAQFLKISDIKYVVGLRNLELSREELIQTGADVEFMREALVQARQAEHEMASEISEQELEALREELTEALPDDEEEIQKAVAQVAEDESWTPILEKAKAAAAEGITDQDREELSVMAAAILMSQNPEVTPEHAAQTAAAAVTESENSDFITYVLMALPVAAGAVAVSLMGSLFAVAAGADTLAGIGFAMAAGSTALLGFLVLLAAGEGAYEAMKAAAPYMRKAWETLRPKAVKAAKRVKAAVARVIGVVVNHVYRPAVSWVKHTAIPVVQDRVICPLKRRLEQLLDWLLEKKDQVITFFKEAAKPEETREEHLQEDADVAFAAWDDEEDLEDYDPLEEDEEESEDESAEDSLEEPEDESAEDSLEEPEEETVEGSPEKAGEETAEDSSEKPEEKPEEDSSEKPEERPVEAPVEESEEEPAGDSFEEPEEEVIADENDWEVVF